MAAKKKKSAPTPTIFFEVACPRVLTIMRATCAELGGRYCIEVDGAGAWTLDFTTASVRKGKEPADVTVALTADQFASLATSKVELAKWVADKQVRCDGDAGKIENVSLVLAFLER